MTSGSPREWALVLGGWVVLAAVVAVWLALDHRPPEWDHANHLERVVECAHDLGTGDVRAILERSSFYPPVVICSAAAVYRAFPSDAAAAQAVIVAFLGLGMAAVYGLGRRLVSGPAGVVAALLFGTAPFVVFSALRFQLDLPLAAMVALTLLTLVQTDGFRHLGWSLLAGVVMAVGMLTKPPFAVYVAPAVVWLIARERTRRALVNAALAVGVAAVVALPWYGPRLFGLPLQIANRSFKNAALEGKAETLTSAALSFYPTWIVNQMGVAAVLLFVAGLVVAVWRHQWFPVIALLVPFATFMLIRNKDLRYTLPLLPLVGVIAGFAYDALGRWGRTLTAGVLALAALVQMSSTVFGLPVPKPLPGIGVPWALNSRPLRTGWPHRDMLALIARDSGGRARMVSVVPNFDWFSVSNFRYYALRDGLPLRFMRAWDEQPLGVDYMIVKLGGGIGPEWTTAKPQRVMARLAEDQALARVYPVIGEFPLPDGSVGAVRARRVPAGIEATPATLARGLEAALRREIGTVAHEVDGLEVTLVADTETDVLEGRVARVEMRAAAATLGEFKRPGTGHLRVRDLTLILDNVLVNPFSALEGRLDALDVGRLRLAAVTILGADLQAFLRDVKQFRRATVALEEGAIVFEMPQAGPDVRARVRFTTSADRPFAVQAERVRVGGVPVPDFLVRWVVRHYDPTAKLASRLPFPVYVGRITITPDAVRISAKP